MDNSLGTTEDTGTKTKQEEVLKVFTRYLYDEDYRINDALKDLSDLGVVIKVDRERPDIPESGFESYSSAEVDEKCLLTQGKMLKAGYEAVESLIKVT